MRIFIPEIIDYEVRRELIRTNARDSIRRLDNLYTSEVAQLFPINSVAMRKAAELWAEARSKGRQTADDRSIDVDVILVAQAMTHCSDVDNWMILTENTVHISGYVGDHRRRSRREIVAEWLQAPRSHLES